MSNSRKISKQITRVIPQIRVISVIRVMRLLGVIRIIRILDVLTLLGLLVLFELLTSRVSSLMWVIKGRKAQSQPSNKVTSKFGLGNQ